MCERKNSRRALIEAEAESDNSDCVHLMLSLSRTIVFLGWLLVSIQTVAMCLAFTGRFSYIGAGVWSGVLVSLFLTQSSFLEIPWITSKPNLPGRSCLEIL